MIHSMTGYGAAQRVENGASYALEMRSVNHRYLKVSIRVPEHLQALEAQIEKLLRSRLGRGSVMLNLQVRSDEEPAPKNVNVAALNQYAAKLAQVTLPGGVRPTIDLAALLMMPGVCEPLVLDDEERTRQFDVIVALIDQALGDLIRMRRQEGEALRRDLLQHAAAIRGRLGAISERAPNVIREYHERLCSRVATLLNESDLELEAEPLRREVAVFAERCDISEEVARLLSHLDQFEQVCSSGDQAGRTLEFLAQELLREANTIASKSNDADISRSVVTIKGLIDRLKEQVQNVE